MEIREKYELRFLEGFRVLKKETQSKKRLERGKRRGKDEFKNLDLKCKTRKMFPLNLKDK
jgi:hypothetical protein